MTAERFPWGSVPCGSRAVPTLNDVLQPIITLAQLGLDRDHVSEAERKAEMAQVLKAAERGSSTFEVLIPNPR